MHSRSKCWCGHSRLVDFSPDYLRCPKCETLVLGNFPTHDLRQINDEQTDLYGANYAERHLHAAYGYPDFALRARQDLPERCLYWLRSILRYKLPPTALLELGSFHGGFVGLAKLAGYKARGLELSPQLAREAAHRFDVEILVGPIEQQEIPAGSVDVIALFDVLEHLQSPQDTLQQCRKLLRPDGLLVMQTPRYVQGRTFAELTAQKDPFLIQLKPAEHLYLFSQSSVKRLLRRTGFSHVRFESAIFAQYDMFLFASALPFAPLEQAAQSDALMLSPLGRFAEALIDCQDAGFKALDEGKQKFHHLEVEFDTHLKELTALYESAEALKNERNLLQSQVKDLQKNFDAVEQDRTARGKVIDDQGARLSELEAEFDTRLKELNDLYPQLEALRNERNLLHAQLADLRQQFDASETDRAARLEVIHRQGEEVAQLQLELDHWLHQASLALEQREATTNERNLIAAQLADLRQQFDAAETDRAAQLEVIHRQGEEIAQLTARQYDLVASIKTMAAELEASQATLVSSRCKLVELDKQMQHLRSRWWFRLAQALRITRK